MDKHSLIRTIVLLIALGNQILVSMGKSPIPLLAEDIELLISTIFTVVVALWAWWKNNYISNKGLAQKEILQKNKLY